MAPKLAVSMSSLSQSYSHWKSCNSESINSRGCLPNKGGSILAFFGLVRPGTYYKTHVHISLTAAAESFAWNIWLQETRLKMICTSEPVTTFSVLLISQFLFLLINPQKSIKGSFSRVLNTILFNVNICMGYSGCLCPPNSERDITDTQSNYANRKSYNIITLKCHRAFQIWRTTDIDVKESIKIILL